ncbi:MAG TPA: HAMP domain-containing sensor histidine kinase [Acidimicrobiales bacterium]|nr:HAMP domain-containing sensor histidine kinase [Acidimicrobiales bacterium]
MTRWRHRLAGVRTRVVVGYVILLAAALAAATLVIRQVLLARLEEQIESALVQEVEELRQLVTGNDPATGEPFGDDVEAIFRTFLARNVPIEHEGFYTIVEEEPFLRSSAAPASLLDDGALVARLAAVQGAERFTVDSAAGEARLLAAPLLGGSDVRGTFVVAYFPSSDRAELGSAIRTIAFVGFGVLVVSSIVAWSLAGRVLRPVRDLTDTARRIEERDLTARIPVQGEDELAELGRTFNAMLDRLQAAFGAQRDFLDDVAHELRTPITIVRGHLELLGDDPADRRETLAVVTDELDRMSRYVGDLLVVAKAGQPDFLRPELVDVGELVEGMFVRIEAIASRDWLLERAPTPGTTWAVADGERLTQAVVNLATNAVQHTSIGDQIGLGALVADRQLRVWIRDSGPGVEPAVRARLFTRFSRGAGSRHERPEGTGLGLAIVAAIANAHGGRVDVYSPPGEGATFALTIPLDPIVVPEEVTT